MNYNGTSVDKVIYNNVIVWEKILFEDISFGYTRKIKSVEVPPGLYKLEVCGTDGNGGGLTGEAGITTSAATSNNCGLSKGTGGTQSVGGASASNVANGTDQGGRGVYTYDGTFGRGGYCSHSCFSGGDGGGGWYGGGQGCHYNGASPGGGGSGYIGENSITHDGVTYINSCTTSSHTEHGSAKISFIAP